MPPDPLVISCDECMMRGTPACQDCVVTYLFESDPDAAVVIDADEARAVRLLARSGLAPDLRHVRRTG